MEIKPPNPIYPPESLRIVHNLFYDWTGWLSEKQNVPIEATKAAIKNCLPLWEKEGITSLLKSAIKGDEIQLLFAVTPDISPVFFTQRIKGRLDHALREIGSPCKFSRKIGLRCLGRNNREIVENYIRKQVRKSDYIDERFKRFLDQFTITNTFADLSKPHQLSHGLYWYNLHLVLVIDDRQHHPMTQQQTFEKMRRICLKTAEKKGFIISNISIMPDHIHLALKLPPKLSPTEIGCSFLNNISWNFGRNHCFSDEIYLGTFSEYGLNRIV